MNLICPVCSGMLTAEEKRYVCPGGHSFDRAKSGYVNLLQRQKHRQRGDDAEMGKARREFLNAGYYQPLLDHLAELASENHLECIADIGCGEGWYACRLLELLRQRGIHAALTGIDISPEILRYAAARANQQNLRADTHWAVASVNHIPLADASCDGIVNLFAPCEPAEFRRILKPGGTLLRAIPLERHLWELKELIYDEPYENRPVRSAPEGFELTQLRTIEYRMTVPAEHLQALFAMTPYAHKTAPENAARLGQIQSLTTTVSFGLLLCTVQK